MRLRPIETVIGHFDGDVVLKGINEQEQAALVIIDGERYLVMVVRKPSDMEIN